MEELDLSDILETYQELRGNPPYNPVMMVKILFYGYWLGIRSSRKLEKALYEDVGFRVLSANQQPDFWTIAAFRRRHLKALGEIFTQTVILAQKAGLVKMKHVAIDGTKIKAYASKHSAMSYGYMTKEEKRIKEEIKRHLKEADEVDAAEDSKFGKDHREDELPNHLKDRQKRLEAIRKVKAELEAEARKKAEKKQLKKDPNGADKAKGKAEQAIPPDKAQFNFTDPESRIMLSSEKSFIQAYNAQAAADAKSQIIVAADLTNQAADSPHLAGLLEQIERNTGQNPQEVSADAGYYSEKNLTELFLRNIEAYIPPEKIPHSEWRNAYIPVGRIPKNMSPKGRMRRKLASKHGRECYKLRQTSIEPIFGQIKECRGLRQFFLRGLAKVRSSWRFECAVHNLIKLFRAGVRFNPQNAGT